MGAARLPPCSLCLPFAIGHSRPAIACFIGLRLSTASSRIATQGLARRSSSDRLVLWAPTAVPDFRGVSQTQSSRMERYHACLGNLLFSSTGHPEDSVPSF